MFHRNWNTLEIEILGKNRVSVITRNFRATTLQLASKELQKSSRCCDTTPLCRNTEDSLLKISKFQSASQHRTLMLWQRQTTRDVMTWNAYLITSLQFSIGLTGPVRATRMYNLYFSQFLKIKTLIFLTKTHFNPNFNPFLNTKSS